MGIALITNNILSDSGTAIAGLVPTSRTISTTAPLTGGGDLSADRTIAIPAATTSVNGYLTSADWTTFNAKQAAGNYIVSLTGEATATGPGAAAVTLNNASVTGKVLTGVNITGGTVLATDTMLTAFGKLQNQINGLIGSTIYQGVWNATTNTPTLASGVGTRGYYYIVNVAGSTNLNGITDWQIGDWAIYDGTAWQKVDNTESVTSVNGFTGAVSLTTDNIAEGATNLYFSNARSRSAISLTTTGSSGFATYNNTTGVLNIPQYQSVLTNPITGSLTASYIPKATGATTLGNSIIYENATGIGIGTNGPLARLHVDSSAALTAIFDCGANNTYISWQNDTSPFGDIGSAASLATGGNTNDFAIRARDTYNIIFATNATEKMRLTNGGKLGIGTTSVPTGRLLAVSGGAQFNGAALMEGANFSIIPAANGQDGVILNVGYDTGTDYGSLFINTGGNTSMTLTKNGAVTFAGSATATSIIKVGGTSSQFLKADGSVDTNTYLTTSSASSTYLPLAGGTLTGALSGTSATFTNYLSLDRTGLTAATPIRFTTAGSNDWFIGSSPLGTSTSDLFFYSYGTSSSVFTLSKSTGAATFSSSVESLRYQATSSSANLVAYGVGVGLGMFKAGTNVLGFAINSSTKMVINSYGNVGIGTTSPASRLTIQDSGNTYSLHVSGNNLTNGIAIGTDSSNTAVIQGYTRTFSAVTNIALQTAGGSVGIGTTSPSATLHVSGAAGNQIRYSSPNVSNILGVSSSDVGIVGTVTGHDLAIYTNATERMRITSSGNVGIGTTSPASLLHVGGSGYFPAKIITLSGAEPTRYSGNMGLNLIGGSSIAMSFGTRNNNVDYDNTLNLYNGNVGIGTTAPTAALTVSGINVGAAIDFTNTTASTGRNFRWVSTNSGAFAVEDITSGGERMRITSGGNVLIGTTTDGGHKLTVSGNVIASAYFESSDKKLKDITYLQDSNTFGAINFNWKDKRDVKNHWGYVAQNVAKFIPDAVIKGDDGYLSVDYNQAHTFKIAKVEDEVTLLKKRVAELEQQLNLN